eukprot:365829-Chlamydomonas_euryale.AAC.2
MCATPYCCFPSSACSACSAVIHTCRAVQCIQPNILCVYCPSCRGFTVLSLRAFKGYGAVRSTASGDGGFMVGGAVMSLHPLRLTPPPARGMVWGGTDMSLHTLRLPPPCMGYGGGVQTCLCIHSGSPPQHRFYRKLAGMTGTASPAAAEFYELYRLKVWCARSHACHTSVWLSCVHTMFTPTLPSRFHRRLRSQILKLKTRPLLLPFAHAYKMCRSSRCLPTARQCGWTSSRGSTLTPLRSTGKQSSRGGGG